MIFWDPYTFVLTVSFIASLTVYYRLNPVDSWLKLFPPFLLTTLLVELIGAYLTSVGRNNVQVYNFFTAFEFGYYLWIISLIINKPSAKKIIRFTMVFYLLITIFNILFIQKSGFHTVTY